MRTLLTLFALAFTAVSAQSQETQDAPPPVVGDALGATHNVHRAGNLWFAGQFSPDDAALIAERGIARAICLRTDGEIDWDAKATLEGVGVEYVGLGFRAPETLTDEIFDALRELLADRETPTLLYCGSANRVGGAWIPFRVLDQGVELEVAVAEAKTVGLRNAGYEARAVAYLEARRGDEGESSVKEGINDSFKDPELDVQKYVDRFEIESREVYSLRHEIVALLGVEPGMRVADIGAGTGLYTFLLNEAVGEHGWVFAVDIAPRFLARVIAMAGEKKVHNVSAVLGQERSVGLPPDSIDLAYICDTYHHFEYPRSTLASIHRALRPGARMVVVDFNRIPGESSDWILDHVRAGKDVFLAEIVAAGFELVREIELEGLEQNYILEFRKPSPRQHD